MLDDSVLSRTLAGNERWFLVHTQPKCEWKAELHLGAQGFRSYLPQILKTIRHARQLRMVRSPLFPRYLFVDSRSRARSLFVGAQHGGSFTSIHHPGWSAGPRSHWHRGITDRAVRRQSGATGCGPRQRAACSDPVRPFCRFRRDARAAGWGRTGKDFARNDGDGGSRYSSPFGACACGVKTAPRLKWREWRGPP